MIYIWNRIYGDISIHHFSSFYLCLKSNWYVRKCLTAFLPFQFIFQDSWWARCIIAKREENDSTPLVRLNSGNIIWVQCRQRQGESGACRKVLNRHQRLDMPFSQRMHILRLRFCLFSSPRNLCSPQHKQAINQQGFSCQNEGCAAHSFSGTVIPVCMSDIQSGSYWHVFALDVGWTCPRLRIVLSISSEAFMRGEESMYRLCSVLAFGCLI